MQNLKPPASLYSWAGRFVSYLVANPEDRFSGDTAHLSSSYLQTSKCNNVDKNKILVTQL